MDRALPDLVVSVEAKGPNPYEAGAALDEETFSASELRAAFAGSWAEWVALIRQDDPAVQAFVHKRQGLTAAPASPSPAKASRGKAAHKRKSPASDKPSSKSVAKTSAPKSAMSARSPAADGKPAKRHKWSHEEELDLVRVRASGSCS